MHWVLWEKVIEPVANGGLGLGSLKDMNSGLLAKWAWRYKTEAGRLWRKVISSIHFDPKHGNFLPSKKGLSCVWNNVIRKEAALKKDNIHLNRLIKGSVGNGNDVQFWTDTWASNISFQYLFPALYSLEKYKGCMVKDRLRAPGPVDSIEWHWHRVPSTNSEVTELNGIGAILAQISITNHEDKWFGKPKNWNGKKDRIKWLPRKVNIFGWRMNLDRLPTRSALEKRHIPITSTLCPLCNEGISGSEAKKKFIHAIMVIACWGIWKLRNEVVFSSKRINIARLMADIKATSYLWVKNRAKLFSVEWVNWLAFDFL